MTDRQIHESTGFRVGLGWPQPWTGLQESDVPRGTPMSDNVGALVGLGWPSGHQAAQESAA